jgi:hypothetical protein
MQHRETILDSSDEMVLFRFRISPSQRKPGRGIGVRLPRSSVSRIVFPCSKPGGRCDISQRRLCDQVLPVLREKPAGMVRVASGRVNPLRIGVTLSMSQIEIFRQLSGEHGTATATSRCLFTLPYPLRAATITDQQLVYRRSAVLA